MEGEYKHSSIQKVQNKEYLIKNACYSVTKYYLCKQNNKRSLLGRKQRSQVARSFPNRYQFSCTNKVTSLFSISCILRIILACKTIGFEKEIVFSAQYFQAIRYKKSPQPWVAGIIILLLEILLTKTECLDDSTITFDIAFLQIV